MSCVQRWDVFHFKKSLLLFLWGFEGKSFALGSVVHFFPFYFLTPKTLNINWKIKMGHKKATYRVCLVRSWLHCTSPQPQWRWCYMVSLWESGLPQQQSNHYFSSPYIMSSWIKQCFPPTTVSLTTKLIITMSQYMWRKWNSVFVNEL